MVRFLMKQTLSGTYTDLTYVEIWSGNPVIRGIGVDQKFFETN